jgi:hypothetical protein
MRIYEVTFESKGLVLDKIELGADVKGCSGRLLELIREIQCLLPRRFVPALGCFDRRTMA